MRKIKMFKIFGLVIMWQKDLGELETRKSKLEHAFQDMRGYHWLLMPMWQYLSGVKPSIPIDTIDRNFEVFVSTAVASAEPIGGTYGRYNLD